MNSIDLLRIGEIIIDLLIEDVENHIQEVPASTNTEGEKRNLITQSDHNSQPHQQTLRLISSRAHSCSNETNI